VVRRSAFLLLDERKKKAAAANLTTAARSMLLPEQFIVADRNVTRLSLDALLRLFRMLRWPNDNLDVYVLRCFFRWPSVLTDLLHDLLLFIRQQWHMWQLR
jgi:hypothetical protein